MSLGPLRDVLICDFSVALSAPIATYALVQMGATSIQIERNKDPYRKQELVLGNPVNGDLGWAARTGGKLSLKVDARKPEGHEILRRLIARSDVVVENFGPGAMERLGLDEATIFEINPRVIYASLKGFNPDSPWGGHLAYDNIVQSAAGAVSVTGYRDGPSDKLGTSWCDIGTGANLALGIVAALFHRARTGEGQRVFISMFDAAIHYMRPVISQYVASGVVPFRNGNLDPNPTIKTFRETFACQGELGNNFCLLEIDTDSEWRLLLEATQMTALGADPRFATRELRHQNADALREALAPWFATRTKMEAMDILLNAGVHAAVVFTAHDFMQEPSLWGEETFAGMPLADGTTLTSLAWPVKFSGFTPALKLGPGWGEHTDEILARLGYSVEEVARLREADVL